MKQTKTINTFPNRAEFEASIEHRERIGWHKLGRFYDEEDGEVITSVYFSYLQEHESKVGEVMHILAWNINNDHAAITNMMDDLLGHMAEGEQS